jgi:hypothetical protein
VIKVLAALASFRIDLLHESELLFRELREMSNEEDQLPILFVFSAPSRHPGEADSVANDVEELTVREFLRIALTKVRRRRVQTLVDDCLAAPIIGMTDGAMIREVVATLRDRDRGRLQRVGQLLCFAARREAAKSPCGERFDGPRLLASAEAVSERLAKKEQSGCGRDHHQHRDHRDSSLHWTPRW